MWLDVAVGDAVLVAEEEGGDYLVEVAARRGFRESALAAELGEELAAGGELHNKVDFGSGGHDFVEFQDVGVVVEAAHGGDFANYAWLHSGVHGGGLVNDLDGYI